MLTILIVKRCQAVDHHSNEKSIVVIEVVNDSEENVEHVRSNRNQQPMRASMTATIGPSTAMMTTATKTTTRNNNRYKRKRDISIQDFRSNLSMIPGSVSSMSMTTAPQPPSKRIKGKKKTKKEKFSINPMIKIHYRYSIIH